MSVTNPTRGSAYGLRIATAGREEWKFFASVDHLARHISSRIYRNNAGRLGSSPRSISFNVVSFDGTLLRRIKRTTVQVDHNHWGATRAVRDEWTTYEAFSPNGRSLKIAAILARGNALENTDGSGLSYRLRHGYRHYCGYGPVPGIRKSRGGSGYMRRIQTTAEKRLNVLVLEEEGEVPARAARCGRNLPSAWDDFMRYNENCWKAQTKGRKSWDRRRHGNTHAGK